MAFESVAFVRNSGIDLKAIRTEKVLFDGSAIKAVKNFPQNINVAAVLSLAGLGLKKTKVRIVASARVKKNIHEIEIISDAAQIRTRTENIAHPHNPKTSFLAVLSAEAVIKQILSPIKIGA
jgi:aspartate dehydrogenase